ncbi:MAG: MerR family transcriptional regulator [Methylibium sp.]|uniref:MerR family transcriptional regulator n=1 Tax=Methylibium sp. TaxID=2067992 RepID=UPI0018292981|nr:MerR family transcriptional regulator [Methylibium sp.]MBA2721519.1 MerR family transcriptional regulator [Methylibium sp.]MBA3590204.1 MerR family transcriptional regulator [Methylibium sp.]MBA3623413.1 MerR family transcriptional regulator [Methylibium sp.]
MNEHDQRQSALLSIAAVERDTGLSKDTLRVWERRYGFPTPARDVFGERAYSVDQVERLRIIKRLMDAGHRPGRIVAQPIEALQRLGDPSTPSGPGDAAALPDLRAYIDRVRAHDVAGLRRELAQAQLRLGLGRFVVEIISPLNTLIGDAWMRGHLEIFEEHLYTESLQVVLRKAIDSVPVPHPGSHPLVLMSTFPNETHAIGLLMAEALFLLEGCRCVSLGPQTPIWDTVLAATALRVDVVAIAFTAVLTPAVVLEGLSELRSKLPGSVDVWAGGAAPVLHRRPTPGVTAVASLAQIPDEVRRWKAARS